MYYLVKLILMTHACMRRERNYEFLAVNRYRQIQGEIQKKYYGKTEKSKEMLISCSPHLATTVELSLCVWPYTVYAK